MRKQTFHVVLDQILVWEKDITVEVADDADIYAGEDEAREQAQSEMEDPELHGWDYMDTNYDIADVLEED
jgi:hypothetical protein